MDRSKNLFHALILQEVGLAGSILVFLFFRFFPFGTVSYGLSQAIGRLLSALIILGIVWAFSELSSASGVGRGVYGVYIVLSVLVGLMAVTSVAGSAFGILNTIPILGPIGGPLLHLLDLAAAYVLGHSAATHAPVTQPMTEQGAVVTQPAPAHYHRLGLAFQITAALFIVSSIPANMGLKGDVLAGNIFAIGLLIAAFLAYEYQQRRLVREAAVAAGNPAVVAQKPVSNILLFLQHVFLPNTVFILVCMLLLRSLNTSGPRATTSSLPETAAYGIVVAAGLFSLYLAISGYRKVRGLIASETSMAIPERARSLAAAAIILIVNILLAIGVGFLAFLLVDEAYHPIE